MKLLNEQIKIHLLCWLCRIVLQFCAHGVRVYLREFAVSTITKDEGWFFDYNQHLYTKVVPVPEMMGKKDRHEKQNNKKNEKKTFVKR